MTRNSNEFRFFFPPPRIKWSRNVLSREYCVSGLFDGKTGIPVARDIVDRTNDSNNSSKPIRYAQRGDGGKHDLWICTCISFRRMSNRYIKIFASLGYIRSIWQRGLS